MPQMLENCRAREYPWGRPKDDLYRAHYAYARFRAKRPKPRVRLRRGYDIARHFVEVIEAQRRTSSSEAQDNRTQSDFEALAALWRRETRFSSSLDEKVLHPAYQSIIAMGANAVPLVLTELDLRCGHWFWALHFMTGADPVPEGSNVGEARQAWLKWGREKGLLR